MGVLISEDLKWGKHITKMCNKANSILAFLRRNLKHCPEDLKKTAFQSLVRSTLEYADVVWDPHLQKDIQSIEKVQRKGARFIVSDYRRESSVTAMLQKLDLQPLWERRREARLTMLYKMINGLVAIRPDDILVRNTRATRNNLGYRQPRCNTTIFQHSYFPRTIKDWNSISDSTKQASSIEIFKSKLKIQRYR